MNKVETMVEGYWPVEASSLFSDEQKTLISGKLANKINADGYLLVKSQTERSQLGNKAEVIKKMNRLVNQAILVPRKRKKTRIPAEVKEKRLESKKKNAFIKESRKKISGHE